MIRELIFAVIMFGLGYLYGYNKDVRVKTIALFKKLLESIKKLIKK